MRDAGGVPAEAIAAVGTPRGACRLPHGGLETEQYLEVAGPSQLQTLPPNLLKKRRKVKRQQELTPHISKVVFNRFTRVIRVEKKVWIL